eukprot:CAMPEP_0170456296 /NCGR_PEP_ID=MMETSP0123-20130129/3982_1 /TAXON_ID=182087 /ORGANISM="Favella ehrenbergii, Strain Fehren 1" /LENGTH=62 /DNA_ID=CAMNT_0010719735 /DNA_START=1494 /DNA_END=1678 /DNA_ORIENTATION=+
MHLVEAAVVCENISVAAAAVDVVAQVGMVANEIVVSRLAHVRGRSIELASASLVLAHSKHGL